MRRMIGDHGEMREGVREVGGGEHLEREAEVHIAADAKSSCRSDRRTETVGKRKTKK